MPGLPRAPRALPFGGGWRRQRLYLVLASRRWRVESQSRPVIHVTPFPGSSRAASCLLLLAVFPFCPFAAVPGRLFSCIYELHENRQYLHFIYLFLQQAELKPGFSRCPSPGVRGFGGKTRVAIVLCSARELGCLRQSPLWKAKCF